MKVPQPLRFKFVCLALLIITISPYAPHARHSVGPRADTLSARGPYINLNQFDHHDIKAITPVVVPGGILYRETGKPQAQSTQSRIIDTGLPVEQQPVRLDDKALSFLDIENIKYPVSASGQPVKELNAGEGRGTIALAEFIDLVATGQPSIVVGVYSSSGFSLPIEQQPVDHPEYVTKKEGVATQFRLAAEYGTIGLLAHNDLGGALFFDLSIGQKIYVVYGDARTEQFEISEIRRYQARQPNSPYSSFIDLDAEESEVAALDLFYEIYGETGHLVFQTCIGKDGIDTWGRYFVIARSKSLDNIRF